MSELLVASSAADTPGQGMSVTAGALLRDAREAAGLHIAALAVALKVPVAKLEALEADNFSALPDMVFVRALASSVCRTLKIDPQAVLALLPQGEGPRLSAGDVGLNAPVKGFAGRSSAAPFKGAGTRSFVWAVGLLLIGAALMMFLPRGLDADLSALLKQPETTTKIPMPTGNVAQEISVAVGAEQRVPSAAPAAAAAAAVGVGVELPAGESIKPAGIASHPIVLPSVEASAPSSAPAADAPSGVLAFKARSESWIQVRDAAGALVLQRNLAPNELVSVSGVLPLAVVIGRADATEVFVRGKPYDIGPVSRENVARFEVK
ncbi:helix-turn-helix domain-containing protein [Acidovorax sp. BoFeN1]|uniref:helix-turn-helix domain-containing protein n=1 Tax=Acidovorax sp. BoFeN1 TaxID=1231053 RepID=UPI001F3769C2|nr:helix-turn-helix domain-containing protein [Acidovorax sp. BoFeN1]